MKPDVNNLKSLIDIFAKFFNVKKFKRLNYYVYFPSTKSEQNSPNVVIMVQMMSQYNKNLTL